MTLLGTDDLDEFPPVPVPPSKSPAPKKVMYACEDTKHVNSGDIVASLSVLINMRSDNIKKMVGANVRKIEGLKKNVDFACTEIKDMKGKVSTLEKQVSHEERRLSDCQQRISELDRYSRRWNLRLYGVEELESEKEDVQRKNSEICQDVLPEQKNKLIDSINTVHHLGTKRPNDPKLRGIIL